MMAGSELDKVFDSLTPVIALTHAVWDRWTSLATVEKLSGRRSSSNARTHVGVPTSKARSSRGNYRTHAVGHP